MKRLKPADRHPSILNAAIRIAHRTGYNKISRDAIAEAAQCSPGLVSAYFGTMAKMRRAIMGEAIRTRDLIIVAQGLACRDKRALGAPEELRRAAVESLMG